MGSFVQLTSADGFHCSAYVAQPAGRPRGGLVVLQEIFGVNEHIRSVAEQYAADGYGHVAAKLWSAEGELIAMSRQTVTIFA